MGKKKGWKLIKIGGWSFQLTTLLEKNKVTKKILQIDETTREKKRKMLIPKNETQDEETFF